MVMHDIVKQICFSRERYIAHLRMHAADIAHFYNGCQYCLIKFKAILKCKLKNQQQKCFSYII